LTAIEQPLFLIGVGRSGTSFIYRLLAAHRQAAWFSNWTNQLPALPQLAALSRLASLPAPAAVKKTAIWPKPHVEGNGIYRYCDIHSLIWQHNRPLDSGDVPPAATAKFIDIIRAHLRYQGGSRFLHKNVNNSLRVAYLSEVFPDARFIHIIRDGRSAAMSLCRVPFWKTIRFWWNGLTPAECVAQGEDPLVLAGRLWQKTLCAARDAGAQLPSERYLEVRYEDFVKSPAEGLTQLLTFCGLPPDQRCLAELQHSPVKNLNDRWKDTFAESSKRALWNEIGETASLMGYS
jgi:hypothetical protein